MQKILLTLSLCLNLSLILSGCAAGNTPKWDRKIWAGDSARSSIRRAQENQEIKASDPAFDSYMAMTYADFRSFYATYVLSCKEWRQGVQMMGADEALQRFSIAMKDLQDEEAAELQKKAALK